MRNRTIQLNIRLTEAENNRLKRSSRKAGLTASAYIRMLINGYHPKETPPIAYDELMKFLYELSAKLPGSGIDPAEFHSLILQLQATVTLPEAINSDK